MKRSSLLVALSTVSAAVALAGCGGGSGDVPASAVAVVDGTEIARSELDQLLEQAKTTYKDNFPKVGTPEYQSLQQQLVAVLVQQTELEQEAEERDISVSEADMGKARKDLLEGTYQGDEKKLEADLEAQGVTDELLEKLLRYSILSQKLYESVTKDVKVTDAEALTYYTQNQDQYGTPESRSVRHILIAEKGADGQVDFEKSKAEADRVYAELQDGADFAALAEGLSADEASAKDGGKYSAVRGASVPEFDKAAFDLDTNEISKPVRTTYGYHLIQPLEDATPSKATPFDQVKATIKASLLAEKKNQVATEWLTDVQKSYEGKVTYAAGLAPPDIPEETDPATVTE
jgi:parvulin-like peptidyl-prolyl isomerase